MTVTPTLGAAYPRDEETDVVLRDGSTVHIRPVRSDDEARIRAFLEDLSADSIWFRFFGIPDLNWATSWSIDVDYADRFALIAETGSPRRIVAHAAYVRVNTDHAEVAFLVADAWQGLGISTILLGDLADVAKRHGISTLTAIVLPDNRRMLDVFRDSGFPVEQHPSRGLIELELPTSLPAGVHARYEPESAPIKHRPPAALGAQSRGPHARARPMSSPPPRSA